MSSNIRLILENDSDFVIIFYSYKTKYQCIGKILSFELYVLLMCVLINGFRFVDNVASYWFLLNQTLNFWDYFVSQIQSRVKRKMF